MANYRGAANRLRRADQAPLPTNTQELLEASSFGTEGARVLRSRAHESLIDGVVARVSGTSGRSRNLFAVGTSTSASDPEGDAFVVSRAVPTNSSDQAGYSDHLACQIAGITLRQMEYWRRTNLVMPSMATEQRGRYSFHDIVSLKVVKRLLDTGVSLQNIRVAVDRLRRHGVQDLATVTLFSDGTTVYECTTPEEIVDLLQGGQGVFGVAVSGAISEVTMRLHEVTGDHMHELDP